MRERRKAWHMESGIYVLGMRIYIYDELAVHKSALQGKTRVVVVRKEQS